MKKKNNKLNRKKGFTLIELLVTITIIAIFSVMLAFISTAITRIYDSKNTYGKAQNLRQALFEEISVQLRNVKRVYLANPADEYINNSTLNSSDLKKEYLYKYSAMFSNKGKIYYIIPDTSHTNPNITDITDTVKENVEAQRDPDGNILSYRYPNNIYLNSLIKGQESAFLKDKNLEDPMDNFEAEVLFYPYLIKDYYNNIDNVKGGVEVRIIIYERNKKGDLNAILDVKEPIVLKNINSIKNAKSFQESIEDGSTRQKIYKVLYYSLS